VWARWRSYWLAPGGQSSAAALRIAIACSLLWMLWRNYPIAALTSTSSYYRIGIWQLYPGRPDAELLSAIEIVAWISTAALLVGAWTRAAHVVSLLSVLALATFAISDTPAWSHTDAPPLLASIAFLGARGGDVWSVDAWWRRWRGGSLPAGVAYQASVRLVQLAVAAVFFIAGYCKIRSGHGLAWALSDNLRHQLLMRFDWIQADRTPVANWLVDTPWRYELCALLNLLSQTTQIAAMFLMRRPLLRAALGAMFCIEVLGLALIMDMWNLHWLPLAAAFIDWDALLAWLRGPAPAAAAPVRAPIRVAFATIFIAFFALQAVWLNQRLRAFPFSSFPMFAAVRAKPPYSGHQSYELIGGHIELIAARPLTRDEQAWLDSHGTYRWMWQDRDPAQLHRDLAVILDETRRWLPIPGITSVRLWLSVFQAPAYPTPAHFERIDVAIIGELGSDGALRTALGSLARDGVTVTSAGHGIDLAAAALATLRDDLPTPRPVTATTTAAGATLAAPLAGDPVYLVATPRGATAPWLVAGRAHRGY
jgi:hypothetical protein